MPKQNLAQATRRSVQNANLSALDNFGSSIDDNKAQSELSLIEEIISEFIKAIKTNLQSKDMIVGGGIENITVEKNGTDINILGPAYLAFMDKGVNGTGLSTYDTPYQYKDKKPPIQPIIDWVNARGLADTTEKAKSIAYAIQNKIFHEGLPPRNVYSNEIPALATALAQHITGFTAKNILDKIVPNDKSK
jgi:hypothetical protein